MRQLDTGSPFVLCLSTLICVCVCAVVDAKLYGQHSDELHSGELTVPRRVNADGAFLTHNLTYFHRRDHRQHRHQRDQRQHRLPRSLDRQQSGDPATSDAVHYQLQLGNQTLHLELEPHTYFMTPHMIIERHRRDVRARSQPTASAAEASAPMAGTGGRVNVDCHFHGKVRGHAASNVALSTCKGLVGHIQTQDNAYFIEPSKHHSAHQISGHPHVVFQRSSVKEKTLRHQKNPHKKKHRQRKRKQKQQQQQQQQPHVDDNDVQQHMQHQHHQKQQQQQQHTRISNCGTKEPRRRLETRLEWQSQGKVKIQGGRKIRRQHPHPHQHQHQSSSSQQTQKLLREELQFEERTIFRYRTASDSNNGNNNNSNNHKYDNSSQHKRFGTPKATTTGTGTTNTSLGVDKRMSASLSLIQKIPTISSSSSSLSTTGTTTATATSLQQQHKHRQQQQQQGQEQHVETHHHDKAAEDVGGISENEKEMTTTTTTMLKGSTAAHRIKRSISSPRHVETLLVADPTMLAFHGEEVTTYLLTIMNMVSALYKDPSIGNSIEIVVVKIILLEEDDTQPDLNLTQNAQKNLDRFCSWQHKLNTASENDPHHHDVAILVTRKNICGNNCMTLGLANVGGMCKPKQSCSVNEDNGIMLSHTITHELGHNFGMFHDTAKIGCHPRVGSIVHIMTPTFGADTLQVCWSNCSRKYITHFLDQGLGDCLDDSPMQLEAYNYPEILPGELYNAERQCRMQFNLTDGIDVSTCSSPHEFCSTLWCRVNGECVTNMRPTAPGTSCGKRKWCQNGKCVRMEELAPVNGGWGDWSEWSECSRSCGGGVSTQQRECNNPVPANAGVFCIGERKRYKICKKRTCAEDEPSFRAQQCSGYDNVTYQGGIYKWQPFFDKNNPCKLICTDEDDTIIANWGDTVLDGTPCTLGTNNMCIDGICKKVGCDWIVDSDMQEDRCGICGGAGDQCKPVKEVYGEAFNVSEGYVEIVTIPAKARHIVIRELANSQNFLGVARANTGHFYLNGDSLISMPGEFVIAGAESLYDRLDEQETIKIPQPIQHSITLYVIVRVNETNEGIYYEFTLPAVNVSGAKQHLWKLSNWTACTATCGGGVQYREAVCYENGKLIGENVHCWTHAKNKRPLRQTRPCNKNACPAQWWTGPWQFCPVTCKQPGMPHPVKRRSVMCLDQHDVVVADAQCSMLPRPPETEYCDQQLPDCKAR